MSLNIIQLNTIQLSPLRFTWFSLGCVYLLFRVIDWFRLVHASIKKGAPMPCSRLFMTILKYTQVVNFKHEGGCYNSRVPQGSEPAPMVSFINELEEGMHYCSLSYSLINHLTLPRAPPVCLLFSPLFSSFDFYLFIYFCWNCSGTL